MTRIALVTSSLMLSISACYPPEANEIDFNARRVTPGPLMRAGDNCLRCHRENGEAQNLWTAAGTVYATPEADRDDGLENVQVILEDSSGKVVTLTTNAAGNFYTAEPLLPDYRVRVERNGKSLAMSFSPPAGSCNACHSIPPVGNAPGRIFAPE